MPSKIAHRLFEFIKVTRIDAPVDDAFITGIDSLMSFRNPKF